LIAWKKTFLSRTKQETSSTTMAELPGRDLVTTHFQSNRVMG
jgi:hypothetical protein